jgi:hypothetical protein
MPAERLVERDVKEVGEGAAGVVADQSGEHRCVMIGTEDALDDRVVAAGKGETGGLVDEADVRAAGNIVLAQDDSPQVVLADDRQAAPVLAAYRCRCRGLAGCGVAPIRISRGEYPESWPARRVPLLAGASA